MREETRPQILFGDRSQLISPCANDRTSQFKIVPTIATDCANDRIVEWKPRNYAN